MRDRTLELELIDAVSRLRERVASMEVEVAHLTHGQGAHTGQLARTDSVLAHIALSLRDAHRLIADIQQDLETLSACPSLPERLAPWTPAAIGVLALVATLAGRGELAAKLLALR